MKLTKHELAMMVTQWQTAFDVYKTAQRGTETEARAIDTMTALNKLAEARGELGKFQKALGGN